MLCGMVWYGMVWFGILDNNVVPYGVICYSMVWWCHCIHGMVGLYSIYIVWYGVVTVLWYDVVWLGMLGCGKV